MRTNKRGLSRYSVSSARSGTWVVNQIPGIALTKREGGWQPVILGGHPQLSADAALRSEQINNASKLLLNSGMIHRVFQTRQQGLDALRTTLRKEQTDE